MHNDLMLFYAAFVLCVTIRGLVGQPAPIYAQRGQTAELCDNRSTTIYAYEYRTLDAKQNSIVEPSRHERYSNPYRTSLLRIVNLTDDDSGFYKCPQDDTEWQKLQVYGK